MTAGVVIVHPEWGIFVGVSFGLAFWSALDSVGQEQAPVMPEDEAVKFVSRCCPVSELPLVTYHPVQIVGDHHATIEELDAAGLSQWTTPLKANRMGEAVGNMQ